ncbi:FAD/NAD(P)-binding domain-containing protein [Gonapodya prolifera JEL478]|uniref:FAD/NAD(P)-binding domain-containing protein n=1 Tax=Gonapodya prolifera (strain JEL478) TaxID=1344416 RepID=A0A139AJG3_GONPJ|nr:FAD/NAD(P)-binding domain-containing protein [Gonapodya prolifera JEL478]|eukprot:KXS16613.1 FAD/NAD(P)-binding domain-containing protein [Gonapodya prolifera JEL478]
MKIDIPPSDRFDVIIVGAGVAGITCARKLADEWPEKRIVVLEASDRVGGQVWTTSLSGVPIDLGASLVYDFHNRSPLYTLTRSVSYELTDAKEFHSDTQPNDGLYEAFKARVSEARQEIFDGEGEDVALGILVDRVLDEGEYGDEQRADIQARYYADTEVIHGVACDKLSSLHFDDVNVDITGGVVASIGGGMWNLFEPLSRNLDIRRGHQVVRVEKMQGSDNVRVAVDIKGGSSGAGSRRYMNAEQVVLSVPPSMHGAASTNTDNRSLPIILSPPVPPRLSEPLSKISFGHHIRVASAWPSGSVSKLLKTSEPGKSSWIHPRGPSIVSKYRVTSLNLGGSPVDVVVAFLAAEAAKSVMEKSDAVITGLLLDDLKNLFPTLVKPSDVLVARWPHSTPFLPPKTTPLDIDKLSRPVGDWLFLAGSWTSDEYFGTLQGAYESGGRVAGQVADRWMA